MAETKQKKTIFKFPMYDVRTVSNNPDDTSPVPIHPRVTFISYAWQSATPKLQNTKSTLNVASTSTTTLYLPANFTEKYSATWGEEEIVSALVDPSVKNALVSGAEAAQKLATDKLGLGGIVSSGKFLAGVTAFPGQFNMFQKSAPVSLDFSFDLLPRNQPEAEEIVSIVQNFKRRILPSFGGDGKNSYMLTFPDIFHIVFSGANAIGFPTMGSAYRDMALVNVSANYGGKNSSLTHYDGNPVIVTLGLTFTAIKHSYIDA